MRQAETHRVTVIDASGDDRAIETIVLAFSMDPIARWTWPDTSQYLKAMPLMARAFGGRAFAQSTAHGVDECTGVALWLPPGTGPDEKALTEVFQRTLSPARLKDVFGLLEQMGQFHPQEPHWYLPLIGVDPTYQSRGCGSALLVYALKQCDREGLPAYLESTNPKNISLYRRHGFEQIGTIQTGGSPVLTPMLRRPR